jgi:hypothetical protein
MELRKPYTLEEFFHTTGTCGTDNRGLNETRVMDCDEEEWVSVQPWDLVQNAIENNVEDETLQEKALRLLQELYELCGGEGKIGEEPKDE